MLALPLLVGCAPARAPMVEIAAPIPAAIDPGPSSMEQEIGGMNEEAVEATFGSIQPEIMRCVTVGAGRIRELGGHFVVSLRIDRDGRARWAHLAESTLGDRDTEKCVLEVARTTSWPRPVGGEGLAKRAFDVDAGVEPLAIKAERVKHAIKLASERSSRCTKGQAGKFVATAYVRPNGRVLSAGVATPGQDAEDAADCLVRELKKLSFGSPGRKPAKITFEL